MSANPSTLLDAPERVLSTLEKDGSRRWMYPRLSTGWFWNLRRIVAYWLIAMFTVIPFLKIGGKHVLLLDVVHRRFTIFGFTFLPTDTLLLALLMLSVLLSIFFVTALLGRVWCGWACPQTVYMEYVFRPIERLFTGRSGKGGKPADVPAWRRLAMYTAFFIVCLHLANTFLAYFVPTNILHTWITSSPIKHPAGFTIVAFVTLLMMIDFCWFREQTCIIACPYGRLQSVLLDKWSLIISYDKKRGEPRGKMKRVAGVQLPVVSEERLATDNSQRATSQGDCVDCSLCVQVCPTGIDIRDGLQVECLACAQCIDACDEVMSRIMKPKGLIRYSSQSAMAGEPRKILRPRLFIYSGIVTGLIALLAYLVVTKPLTDVTVLRSPGLPYTVNNDGTVANILKVKITNRTDQPQAYSVSVAGRDDITIMTGREPISVAPAESVTEPIRVVVPAKAFNMAGTLDIQLRVTTHNSLTVDRQTRLLGPPGAGSVK